MVESIVTVSRNSKPIDYEGVWIQAERENVSDCIKAAMRMRPDKLVITKECIGLFIIQ